MVPIAQIASEAKSDLSLIAGHLLLGDQLPDIPAFRKIDAAEAQLDAIEDNLAALPSAGKLAAKVNKLSQEQLDDALRTAIPDYDKIRSRASQNIASLLAGEVPEDVQRQIQRNAAVKALGGGFGGSGMHRNLMARDLGLTSLNLQQQGQTSAERWLTMARSTTMAPLMNVTSMFFTPQQRLEHEIGERDRQFSRDLMAAEIDAIPTGFAAQLGRAAIAIGSKGGIGGSPVQTSGFNLGPKLQQYPQQPMLNTPQPVMSATQAQASMGALRGIM